MSMSERLPKGTETLLRYRAKIDERLVTRYGLEVAVFRSVHSSCVLQICWVDNVPAGYNATHEVEAYHPRYLARCTKHGVDSNPYVEFDKLTY